MKSDRQGGRMSDPIRLPASTITEDVAELMAAAPQPVIWATLQDKLDSATWEQLLAMARGGVGEPHE